VPVTLDQLLTGAPQGRAVPAAEVAALASASDRVLVVLDDDPTGTQSVANLPVLMNWTVESLVWALSQGAPAVYVMTNSRSLGPADAEQRNREVARAAFEAAAQVGVRVDFVSRSDSTLRGHFPLEPDTLAQEVLAATSHPVDGVVVIPAFGEAGRITVDAIHYAGSVADGYTPAGETEFAKDATFGYAASDLRDWVQEKTGGRVGAADVAWIPLATLRTDPAATVAILAGLRDAQPLVCDIVDENDLRLLAVALYTAEAQGKRFIYRVGPPFGRAIIGQDVTPPLEPADIAAIRAGGLAQEATGGLIVVGSHVSMTTRQLAALVEADRPVELEIDVATVLSAQVDDHIAEVTARAVEALAGGNVVVRTSRTLVRTDDADESLAIARRVSTAVITVVAGVLAQRPPRFVVAKGGITSSDVAARGLSIERAMVRGPMLPGIVSLWEPIDGPARGIPYIVFAGNVGGPSSLAEVVHKLSA